MGDQREKDHFEDLGVWEDNIKMDSQEGWGDKDWFALAQDRDGDVYL